jgi:hypothetical protein
VGQYSDCENADFVEPFKLVTFSKGARDNMGRTQVQDDDDDDDDETFFNTDVTPQLKLHLMTIH